MQLPVVVLLISLCGILFLLKSKRPHRSRNEKRIVYTYYEDLNNENSEMQSQMLQMWLHNWYSLGYNPMILNASHSRRHPRYEEYMRIFSGYPTVNNKEYEMACYRRWVALAAMGGGILMDYDMLGLLGVWLPVIGVEHLQSWPLMAPMLTVANHIGVERILDCLINFDGAWETVNGKAHISDMLIIRRNMSIFDKLYEEAPRVLHFSQYAYSTFESGGVGRVAWTRTVMAMHLLNSLRIGVASGWSVDLEIGKWSEGWAEHLSDHNSGMHALNLTDIMPDPRRGFTFHPEDGQSDFVIGGKSLTLDCNDLISSKLVLEYSLGIPIDIISCTAPKTLIPPEYFKKLREINEIESQL